nr:hypothetical protein BaRGS_008322 [Batillaria attramentaria]
MSAAAEVVEDDSEEEVAVKKKKPKRPVIDSDTESSQKMLGSAEASDGDDEKDKATKDEGGTDADVNMEDNATVYNDDDICLKKYDDLSDSQDSDSLAGVKKAGYEVVGDTVKGDDHKGPKKARLSSAPLLAGFAFTCVGVSPDMTKNTRQQRD